MRKSRSIRYALPAAAVLITLALASPGWCQAAGTAGIKGGERFASTGEDTAKALTEVQTTLQSTLDAYNTLVGNASKDPKGDYKKLLKKLDATKKKIAVVKPKLDVMNGESETYFKLWESQVGTINDADLKARGQERIGSTRKEYEGILVSLRDAAQTLDPFLKDLTDQINFLGSDLRPEALESLKPNAEKLNERGKTLLDQTNTTVTKSNAFFAPLKQK
jgi:ElaB/YqjD/DUF883 family membrane-anchored ribosome-binding protein